MVDADDAKNKREVSVGILPGAIQAIRIGPSEVYKLKTVLYDDKWLKYSFEGNVTLLVWKSSEDPSKLLYFLKCPSGDQSGTMLLYKTICMASEELDKISELQ
jgi:hypothetical protein